MQGSEKQQVKGIPTGDWSGMEGRGLRRAACAQGDSSAAVRWVVGGLLEGGDGGFVHAPLNFY